MRGKWLLFVRRTHLYLGVFFAPFLLLFVITGWWQTVSIDRNKGVGASAPLIQKLSDIHMSQYYPVAGQGYAGKAGHGRIITWPVKWLVVAMCIALIISISLGIVLAFTMVRNRLPVWIALILGIAVPVLLLALAHVQ